MFSEDNGNSVMFIIVHEILFNSFRKFFFFIFSVNKKTLLCLFSFFLIFFFFYLQTLTNEHNFLFIFNSFNKNRIYCRSFTHWKRLRLFSGKKWNEIVFICRQRKKKTCKDVHDENQMNLNLNAKALKITHKTFSKWCIWSEEWKQKNKITIWNNNFSSKRRAIQRQQRQQRSTIFHLLHIRLEQNFVLLHFTHFISFFRRFFFICIFIFNSF